MLVKNDSYVCVQVCNKNFKKNEKRGKIDQT